MIAFLLALAFADPAPMDRERLHVIQKELLIAQSDAERAKRVFDEKKAEYDALMERARAAAKKGQGCVLDVKLEWQCPPEEKKK